MSMGASDLNTLIFMAHLFDSEYGDAFREQFPSLVAKFKELVCRLEDDTES